MKLLGGTVLAVSLSLVSLARQQDNLYIDEVGGDFLKKLDELEKNRDWEGMFREYDRALTKWAQKVCPAPEVSKPPATPRWVSLPEFLLMRFSRLPMEAFVAYRAANDARAAVEYRKGAESGDRTKLEQVFHKYFFTRVADEAADALANVLFEEGQPERAAYTWDRLLQYYPDPEIPRTVLAARLAMAYRCAGGMRGDREGLRRLRRYLEGAGLDGPVTVGTGSLRLRELVDRCLSEPESQQTVSAGALMPWIPEPADRLRPRSVGVRNDIRRWSYDFSEKPPASTKRPVVLPVPGAPAAAVSFGEFPYFPSYARFQDREYLAFSNGEQVVCVNPAKVSPQNPKAGVYWSTDEIPRGLVQNVWGTIFTAPYFGCAIDRDRVFANMYSRKKVRDASPQQQDTFDGPAAIRCFDLKTGRLLWDTDTLTCQEHDPPHLPLAHYDFWDKNFSFSSHPVVVGERLFVGINTSPLAEQESRVLCLDRKTGRPLWCTFLCSVTGSNQRAYGTRVVTSLTLLAERGGVVVALTNLGCVAALTGATGDILWLTRYARMQALAPRVYGEARYIRPPNWPLVERGAVWCLPQDSEPLLVLDVATGLDQGGECIDLEEGTGRALTYTGQLAQKLGQRWNSLTHVIGVVNEWLVLGGAESCVLNLDTAKTYSLPASDVSRSGFGAIAADTILLPITKEGPMLARYDVYSMRNADAIPFKDAGENGNLVLAGDHLAVMSGRLTLYTDAETMRRTMACRLRQSPPDPEAHHEHARLMRENGRLEEAAEHFLLFVDAASGDPKYEAKIREVRRDLHAIFYEEGERSLKSGSLSKALEQLTLAKEFAYDEKTLAGTCLKVAQCHERRDAPAEAVKQYQNVIEKARDAITKPSDGPMVQKAWKVARERISELLQTHGPAVYEEIEKEARERLNSVTDKGVEAYRRIIDLYPNSQAARQAFQKVVELFEVEGNWIQLLDALRDYADRYQKEMGPEFEKKILDTLEKIGDIERLKEGLKKLKEKFGLEMMNVDGTQRKVGDYVTEKLGRIEAGVARSPVVLSEPMKKIFEWPMPPPETGKVGRVAVAPLPLVPLGIMPPAFGRSHELFKVGSSVEFWDLAQKRRVWVCPYPGGYLGAFYGAPKSGGGVLLESVVPESPAGRAGLRSGDVVLAVDGRAVDAESFGERMLGFSPGARVTLTLRREHGSEEKTIVLSAYPEGSRPGIIGSAFTRDYALVVAWEWGVASIHLQTGSVNWIFREIRDGFRIRSLHATDGRLYITEFYAKDQKLSSFRVLPAEALPSLEDAVNRVFCLDDASGEILWARAFPFDPPFWNTARLSLFVAYFGSAVTVLDEAYRRNVSDAQIWVLRASDGAPSAQLSLGEQILASVPSLENGMFFVVDRNRILSCINVDPAKRTSARKLWEFRLEPRHFDQAAVAYLGVGEEFIALVAPPSRMTVFRYGESECREDRIFQLQPDRILPNRVDTHRLEKNGLFLVYNIPKSGGPRAYWTAYDLKKEGTAVEWDALVPLIQNNAASTTVYGTERLIVFASPSAAMPLEAASSAYAAVYSRERQGELVRVFKDLMPLLDANGQYEPLVTVSRERLYVIGRSTVEVYE